MSSNIFQGSDFAQSEDIMIIVENSSLLNNSDIAPNTRTKLMKMVKDFINARLKIDYRDRYYLIVYGAGNETYTPLDEPENFSHALMDQLQAGLSGIPMIEDQNSQAWTENLMTHLQSAIQKCITTFKQIRNKTLRIILVLNQIFSVSEEAKTKIEGMIQKTAQRLDIVVDVILLAGKKPIRVFEYENILKQLADMTGGMYLQVKNAYELQEAFDAVKEKKEILKKRYLGQRIYAEEKKFLEVIASDLNKITQMLSEADLKCNICFKATCDCEIADMYEHLRSCPNCEKIMHVCCAGRWAEQQNSKSNFIGFPNVFRCPYCFYLLKVPREFVNFESVLQQLQEKWLKQKEQEDLKRLEDEKKEKDLHKFIGEVVEQKSEEEKIIQWLTERLPDKSRMDIKRLCDDILIIKDVEERISFMNYLKFKEGIEDDTLPF